MTAAATAANMVRMCRNLKMVKAMVCPPSLALIPPSAWKAPMDYSRDDGNRRLDRHPRR